MKKDVQSTTIHKNDFSNLGSVEFWLFLICFISFAYFYPGAGDNETARFDSIRALLDEGHFYVDSFAYNSADLIKVGEHYYSSKAPGTMILALPVYWLTDRILMHLRWINPDVEKHWVCYLSSLFTVGFFSALTSVFIYKLGLRLKIPHQYSAVVALSLVFGTILFPFSTVFFGHAILAFLVLFASFQILAEDLNYRKLWLAGLAMGFAVVVEFPAAIADGILLIFAVWILRRKPLRLILHLILAIGVGLLPLLIHNYLAFGNPFFITYSAYAAQGSAFQAHKYGILGIRLPFLSAQLWHQFFHNLAEITFRPLRGLFFLNPVLWLILPGFAILFSQWEKNTLKKETLLSFSLCAAYFIFNASYGNSIVYWGGGASFGPRHLSAMIPLLSIPFFGLVSKPKLRLLLGPFSASSVFICTIGTAIQPLAPYGPNNLFFEWYLPRFLAGKFSTNLNGVFSHVPITADSVAFNWGKFMGLPGPYQLWPLLLFWLLAAAILERKLRMTGNDEGAEKTNQRWKRGGPIFWTTAILCCFLGLLPGLA
jgi:hypothetical protein